MGLSWDFLARNERRTLSVAFATPELCATKAKRWPSVTEGHFELPCDYESKQILVKNFLYENELYLFENETVEETHLEMKGFETRFDKEAEGN